MKKFVFTLQKLYDVKASEEKQRKTQLRELERSLDNYRKQKNATRHLYDREHAQYEKKCKTGMSMFEVQRYGDYFQYLEKEMRQQDNIILSCEKSIEDCRASLVKLMNEQKVLDRMRDEQKADWQKEVAKDDGKTIEDFMQARI